MEKLPAIIPTGENETSISFITYNYGLKNFNSRKISIYVKCK